VLLQSLAQDRWIEVLSLGVLKLEPSHRFVAALLLRQVFTFYKLVDLD